MSTETARYAIYFTPSPESELWRKGWKWLGRNAESGKKQPQPSLKGLTGKDIAKATALPRAYGFHATLKPPFHLADGRDANQLHLAAKAFCHQRTPFRTPPFTVHSMGDFIALGPRIASASLTQLAEDCLRSFDPFRAPSSETELAKRRARGLSGSQDVMLTEWGYPYVLEEFRFHMTLTGPLPETVRSRCEAALRRYFAIECKCELYVDGLAVFRQATPDSPFLMERRYRFNAAALKEETAA